MRSALLLTLVTAAIVGVCAGSGSAAPGATAGVSWSSDYFRSPTGNIRCRWFTYDRVMACKTLHNGRVGVVPLYGSAYSGYFGGYSFPSGPTLYYGQYWSSNVGGTPHFRCDSRSSGMTCFSRQTGRGFTISRESFRTF